MHQVEHIWYSLLTYEGFKQDICIKLLRFLLGNIRKVAVLTGRRGCPQLIVKTGLLEFDEGV